MLIGRDTEVKKLEELYHSDSAELVALYGRRRVGKTFLIDETFGKKIIFRHAGLSPINDTQNDDKRNSRMKDQLEHFNRSLIIHGTKKKPLNHGSKPFIDSKTFLLKRKNKQTGFLSFLMKYNGWTLQNLTS